MLGLYLLICTESVRFFTVPPLVAIICYFTLKQAGDQVLGLFLDNKSLVLLSAANQIHLTKSVCPSINLFTCLFVPQPVHPPACPLVYCQSMSTVGFSVSPSGCMSDCLSIIQSVVHLLDWLFICLHVYPSLRQVCITERLK